MNRWLRELPVSGAPSPNTWEAYARALRDWLAFLGERGVAAFDSRDRLRAVLSVYAEYRLAGPLAVRLAESSWNLHVTAVARFYEWTVDEGHATAVPFTYAWARRFVHGEARTVRRNLAKLREPKPATTIKYLEPDFAELFVQALEGLQPDGAPDPDFRGHDPGRNATMARFVLASGLRRREFTYLLAPESTASAARADHAAGPGAGGGEDRQGRQAAHHLGVLRRACRSAPLPGAGTAAGH